MDEFYLFLKLMGGMVYVIISIYASLTSLKICKFRSYFWATSQDEKHIEMLMTDLHLYDCISTEVGKKRAIEIQNSTTEQLGCCAGVFFNMIVWPVILFCYIVGKYVPTYTRKICTFFHNLHITIPRFEIKISFKKKSGCACRTDIPYPNY